MFTQIHYTAWEGNSPAKCNRATGELFINVPLWNGLTEDEKKFVKCHEWAHIKEDNANDETRADKVGYEQCYTGDKNAPVKLLSKFIGLNNSRAKAQINRTKISNFTGMNTKSTHGYIGDKLTASNMSEVSSFQHHELCNCEQCKELSFTWPGNILRKATKILTNPLTYLGPVGWVAEAATGSKFSISELLAGKGGAAAQQQAQQQLAAQQAEQQRQAELQAQLAAPEKEGSSSTIWIVVIIVVVLLIVSGLLWWAFKKK